MAAQPRAFGFTLLRLSPFHFEPTLFARAAATMRRLSRCLSTVPILSATEALTRWRAVLPSRTASDMLACYSSQLGGIVTDPALMVVPIDDHGFHRGHAVFDTCNVAEGRAFGLTMHLDRLLGSAKQARIVDDAGASHAYRESLRSLVLQTIAATGRRDNLFVRYWLTVGRGDFSISPKGLTGGPCFYCVAHEDSHTAEEPRGVHACIVPTPLKPPFLATMKSNNYLLNALVAMDAEAAGADLGIQIEDGVLAESAVSTIAIVDSDGVLRSPPAQRILRSTTWVRAIALAESLVADGTLSRVESASHITEQELRGAREVLNLGGGWLSPIVSLDGVPIGDGEPGPVFRALDPAVRAEFADPEMSDPIPYAS